MRRALLATLAAWGAAGMTLQAFPVAWGWAHLVLSFAFLAPCSWLARSLTRALPESSGLEWALFDVGAKGRRRDVNHYPSRERAERARDDMAQLGITGCDVGWRAVSDWQFDGDGKL